MPYAAHLVRLDYLLIYLPTQVQLTLTKIIKIVAQMTDFKAKMHPIRFWLGLRPRPRWGAYSAPPDLLAGFGDPTSKERGGGQERGGEVRGGEGKGKGKGHEPPSIWRKFTPMMRSTECPSSWK